jgi:DNA-binding transcriptional ArsR family regulator
MTKTAIGSMTVDGLQVIAEPHRRRILRLVWDDELPAGAIAGQFEVTFGAISQHLAVLRDVGFVEVRADGNRRLYRANKPALGPLRTVLEEMWSDALDVLAHTIEEDEA